MKRSLIITLASTLALMAYSLPGSPAETGDAKALFEKKCGLCHPLARPEGKIKTLRGWRSTVMRMKNINRAPITDQEAEMIIQYLFETHGKK